MDGEKALTHAIAFLIGAATGAAAHYLGEKCTDRRRDKERERAAKRSFDDAASKMTDLFRAFRTDLDEDTSGVIREFFAIESSKITLGGSIKPRFRYDQDKISNLLGMLEILQEQGCIADVRTRPNTAIYRFSEDFVSRLKRWKVPRQSPTLGGN